MSSQPQVFSLPAHRIVFSVLRKRFHDEVLFGLTEKYRRFRCQKYLAAFEPFDVIHPDMGWDFAKSVLDAIDAEMGKIICRRSTFYWLHLYRRIGVQLSPLHENKTDPITLLHVREYLDCAIQKHGKLTSEGEFGKSNQLSPNLMFGGWLRKGMIAAAPNKAEGRATFERYCQFLKQQPTLVVRDFGKKDFVDIYELEGLSYQYWRITAQLRTIGKGASFFIDEEGETFYADNPRLTRSLESFDKRIETGNAFSSRLGIWLDRTVLMGGPAENTAEDASGAGTVFFPIYNVAQADISEPEGLFGFNLPPGSTTNFFPYYFHVGRFLNEHSFMENEFEKDRGYSTRSFLDVLVALSSLALLPEMALYEEDPEQAEHIKIRFFMQILTRGYNVFVGSLADLAERVKARIELFGGIDYDIARLEITLISLSLTQDIQPKIAPWSGGPRALITPTDDAQIVDFAAIPSILQTLFVFLDDRQGQSGTVFERLFREALECRAYSVSSGDLIAKDGSKRDLDAGVLAGTTLFIFECVSPQRRLDYEIGKPKTLDERCERLAEKLDQARTLGEFIRKNPKGRSYDFSEVEEIRYFVVSPFVEWVWGEGEEFFDGKGNPRIIAPEEAFSILDHNSSEKS